MAQERIPHLDMQWASQTKILQLQFVTCILLEVENDIKPARIILGEKASKKKVLPFAGTVRIGSCRRRRHCGSSSPDRSPPAVGVAFLAAAPSPTANAAGQQSQPIWWSRMPQKQSTVSHVALGRGSGTRRFPSAAPSASTHLWAPAPPPGRALRARTTRCARVRRRARSRGLGSSGRGRASPGPRRCRTSRPRHRPARPRGRGGRARCSRPPARV